MKMLNREVFMKFEFIVLLLLVQIVFSSTLFAERPCGRFFSRWNGERVEKKVDKVNGDSSRPSLKLAIDSKKDLSTGGKFSEPDLANKQILRFRGEDDERRKLSEMYLAYKQDSRVYYKGEWGHVRGVDPISGSVNVRFPSSDRTLSNLKAQEVDIGIDGYYNEKYPNNSVGSPAYYEGDYGHIVGINPVTGRVAFKPLEGSNGAYYNISPEEVAIARRNYYDKNYPEHKVGKFASLWGYKVEIRGIDHKGLAAVTIQTDDTILYNIPCDWIVLPNASINIERIDMDRYERIKNAYEDDKRGYQEDEEVSYSFHRKSRNDGVYPNPADEW